MRARLQLRLPVLLGGLFLLKHSLLCVAVWRASLANMEFGVLWEHMRRVDLPLSLLSEWFFAAYEAMTPGANARGYHTPFLLFHLVCGGAQSFALGWFVGFLLRRAIRRRSRR